MKRKLRFGACALAAVLVAGACAVPAGAYEGRGYGYAVGNEKHQWMTSGFCGSINGQGEDVFTDSISWALDDSGTLTITGTGSMYSFCYAARGVEGGATMGSPWAGNPAIRKAVLEKGITTIGTCAFSGCENLAEIVIPDSVTNIESDAFWNTAWYQKQPDGMVYAGKVAYAYKGIPADNTVIDIKEGTLSICSSAFNGDDYDEMTGEGGIMQKIKTINLPESLLNFDAPVIKGTDWWNEQPDGIVYVNHVAYANKGTVPESITFQEGTLGINSEFMGTYWENNPEKAMLKSVIIPASVQYIGYFAFASCENLSSVTIENPDCVINDALPVFYQKMEDPFTYIFDGTIYGYANSTAESYARKHGLRFRVIGTDEGFEPGEETQLGDFTEDGQISIDDAQLTLKIYTESVVAKKEVNITESQRKAGDINKDGEITVEDAQLILKYYTQRIVAQLGITWDDILKR